MKSRECFDRLNTSTQISSGYSRIRGNCSGILFYAVFGPASVCESPLKRTSPKGFHVLSRGFIPANPGWLSSYHSRSYSWMVLPTPKGRGIHQPSFRLVNFKTDIPARLVGLALQLPFYFQQILFRLQKSKLPHRECVDWLSLPHGRSTHHAPSRANIGQP